MYFGNCPSGTVNGVKDCFTYQSSTNSTNAVCSYIYGTFSLCGEMGLFPALNTAGLHYEACSPGNDFTSDVTNVVYRYNIVRHVNGGFTFGAALSDCGDPSNGIHFVSIHDVTADDLDASTYGVLGGKSAIAGKASAGSYYPDSQSATQLNSCSTSSSGVTTCTPITVTHCTRSGGTATITTSAAHGFSVGQTVLVGGLTGDISLTAFNSATLNGSLITAVPSSTQISYALSGTSNAACTGSIWYPSSESDITVNHVTILPAVSNSADKRAMKPASGQPTAGMGSWNVGASNAAYLVNFTLTNSIGLSGIQLVPSQSAYPSLYMAASQEKQTQPVLNSAVSGLGNLAGSWCWHNNVISSNTLPIDPYNSGSAYPANPPTPFSPIPGDGNGGTGSNPSAGTCPTAAATVWEVPDYTQIGFTNLASAGTCYSFKPGMPVYGGGTLCPANPGVPNYKLTGTLASSYINASQSWNGSSWVSDNAPVTAWSIASNVLTVTASNSFSAGQVVWLTGFPTSTFLNAQQVTVLSTGLSGSQFKANFTHGNGSNTETGCASLNGYCDIGSNADLVNSFTQGVY